MCVHLENSSTLQLLTRETLLNSLRRRSWGFPSQVANSPDFAGMGHAEAIESLTRRIGLYEEVHYLNPGVGL